MTRTAYGYPVDIRLQQAKRVAAQAAVRLVDRNCTCSLHKQAAEDDKLRHVMNIVKRWEP